MMKFFPAALPVLVVGWKSERMVVLLREIGVTDLRSSFCRTNG